MSEPFDLQAIACKVYSVLTKNPQARDDDKILLVEIWSKETKAKDISEFLSELLSGKISFPDTVTESDASYKRNTSLLEEKSGMYATTSRELSANN